VCGDHRTITAPIDYEQFCGSPILDPKSLEETAAEVQRAKEPAKPQAAAGLDERGLPPGYAFKPDWEVTPREVKSMLDKGEKFVFIDCRLPNEYDITRIEGAKLIPLQQLAQRFGEIKDQHAEKVVVHCRSGGRSLQFAQALRQAGFKDVKSMAGGILLWNKDVNPGGPQY
jgi:adenylyltransferase/sulfurtransferase